MRPTSTSTMHSVSPHISSGRRKCGNSSSNRNSNDPARMSPGLSPGSSASCSKNINTADSNSIATSATEHSSPLFADATFERKSSSLHIDVEYLERTERILRFAQKRLKKSRSEDFFERKQKKSPQPQPIFDVQHSDVELDAIVGNGSYNIVYSVKRIKGNSNNNKNLRFEPEDVVVKTLRSKLLTDLPMLAACAADLHKEGFLLAGLQQQQQRPYHDHILKVLAWVPTGLSAFANGSHDSFFLVLEKLDRTLTDVLREWKLLEAKEQDNDAKELQERQQKQIETQQQQQRGGGGFRNSFRRMGSGRSWDTSSRRSLRLSNMKNSFFRGSQRHLEQKQQEKAKKVNASAKTAKATSLTESEKDESSLELFSSNSKEAEADRVTFWKMRLGLLVDLSGAISFLHSNRVIHRDLKPDNVGFDRFGKLKVFDFDVARVLPHQANWGHSDVVARKNETFKLTKKVGSPRYMSPECARGEYYNEKADVYALGLLAYEILSLKRPFDVRCSSSDERKKNTNKTNCVYKDCVKVVDRREDGNYEDYDDGESSRGRGIFRRKKRRNSFPFKKQYTDKSFGGGSSSGKLGGIFSRRRCSGSHKNNNTKSTPRSPPKYANIRPLLPVATRHELVVQQQQHAARNRTNTRGCSANSNNRMIPRQQPKLQSRPQQHYHAVNEIDAETSSYYWTQSLRCTIDRAWSYDIPTRPFASELRVLLGEELIRMDWHELE